MRGVIVTTRFPDLPPGPETPHNAAFRRRFRAGWGQVDSVFLARTERIEMGPLPSTLSIKLVCDGAVALQLGRRRLRLEPGRVLLCSPGLDYSFRIDQPTTSFSLHFSPALACEVAASQGLSWRAALDEPRPGARATSWWRDRLQPLDAALGARLARMRERVLRGAPCSAAFDEDFIVLLGDLLARECRQRSLASLRLSAQRVATRDELLRRIGWAVDFIESHYARPIGLADVASAAHLSRFHCLRAFKELQGCTPSDYLRGRRLQAARRLMAEGSVDLDAVLAGSGFGSRWTLQRALRRGSQG